MTKKKKIIIGSVAGGVALLAAGTVLFTAFVAPGWGKKKPEEQVIDTPPAIELSVVIDQKTGEKLKFNLMFEKLSIRFNISR